MDPDIDVLIAGDLEVAGDVQPNQVIIAGSGSNGRGHWEDAPRMVNLNSIIGGERTSVSIGSSSMVVERCIAIGQGANCSMSDGVVVCTGPNNFIDPDSNINFAHVMEANSKTKDVIFPKNVTSHGGFYYKDKCYVGEVTHCAACDWVSIDEPSVGFQWNTDALCMNCIRDVAIQFRAKESWASRQGDPIALLQKKLADTNDVLDEMRKTMAAMRIELNKKEDKHNPYDSDQYD